MRQMFFAKVTPTFLLSVPLVVFSCRTETLSGGLMLQIDQDGTLELDEIRVWVGDVDGKELADESYRGEDVQDLPKTVRIANGQPERDVMLRVSAWNTETPLDVRDLTVLDVPNDSVKTVTITLSAQCSDAVKLEGGQAVSKCELGQTCDPASGDCISSEVDGGDLPDFVPEEGLGGDTGAGNGDGTGGNEGSGGVQVSSSAGPDYAQELGAACKKTGAVTCDRNSARQTLICIRGEWDSNGGCDKDEACDPEVGACAPLVPECAGREPGGRYCEGDDLFTCGPNLVSVELDEECPGLCVTTTTSAKCAPATCGDGKEQANEDCDDGDKDNDDDCTQLCKPPKCGDGFEQTGEVCDDGNRVDGDGCSANCTSNERCGNDIIDINARKPEVCDDANTTPGDGCSADCLSNEVCGNGIVDDVNVDTQQPEACDDGNVMDSGDVCSNSCTLNLNCGNGVVDEGEDCDTSLTRPEICTSACQFSACGDGIYNEAAGEDCDPGEGQDESPTCNDNCTIAKCGDGRLNATAGEQCDPDRYESTEACNWASNDPSDGVSCRWSECGDGFVNPDDQEQCDPGVQAETATCNFPSSPSLSSLRCTRARCGDSYVNSAAGEECDPGTADTPSCNYAGGTGSRSCRVSRCGDGYRNGAANEQCDDANSNNNDGCTNACTLSTVP